MNRKNTYWNFFDAYVDLKKNDYILIFQKKSVDSVDISMDLA